MRCPYCKANDDKVIDSRTSGDAAVIRRRRECLGCHRRFTTYETVEETQLRVVKKDGTRVPFDRNKLLAGVRKACEKRPVSHEQIEEMGRRIEAQLNEMFEKDVSSRFIGDLVMNELRKLDPVAYVRFASVYREFKDVEQFLEELAPLLNERPERLDRPDAKAAARRGDAASRGEGANRG
jgi:transcriptional repressor NrdR